MSQSASEPLKWWQQGVVYQIYPRSFKDTSGNGVGDLQGVFEKLDYLNQAEGALGIDAIWLSPFYSSPMADFGYDVADYCAVHPLFGDMETFDRLVKEAHRRNIKIIIDFVPNHTSDQHPWFMASRSSRDDPKRDWYIWRDPKPDGTPPNNWGSLFGGRAWEWDASTGQYYFHHFLKEQPDLNWRNPEVKEAMLEVLRFWLERGVDGFRMDVVGMILKDPDFRDNPPNPDLAPEMSTEDIWGQQINLYNQDLDEVHLILSEFRLLLDSYSDRCAIGEVWSELPRWIKYYGERGEGLHLPFNFRLIQQRWSAEAIRRSVDEMEAALPPFAWPNYVLGNHDVPRLASRMGQVQARLAALLLLTLRGTPTLYYGDELGIENGLIPLEKMQDPQGLRLGEGRSRDVSRTPMQWSPDPYAGFSESEPWLPVGQDYCERNVQVQQAEPESLLNVYRRILALRRRTPALTSGSYSAVETGAKDCFVYLRSHPEGSVMIALNFSNQAQTLSIPGAKTGKISLSTYLGREETVRFSDLHLRPDEGLVIAL